MHSMCLQISQKDVQMLNVLGRGASSVVGSVLLTLSVLYDEYSSCRLADSLCSRSAVGHEGLLPERKRFCCC